jgi:hypothetical protein
MAALDLPVYPKQHRLPFFSLRHHPPSGLSRLAYSELCVTEESQIRFSAGVHKLFCLFIHSLIHFVVCVTKGPQPLPNRVLHRVRSSASSFNFRYPLFPLKSSSSCRRLLPRLSVTSIFCPSVFSSGLPDRNRVDSVTILVGHRKEKTLNNACFYSIEMCEFSHTYK